MTGQRSGTIQLSHRAFAAALLAAGILGVGIGEAAEPLGSSQAQSVARVAAAPAACDSFATNVGHAFTILGGILEDASKYPPLITKAEQARTSAAVAAITAKERSINNTIQTGGSSFAALKTPILNEETKCLQ
ncbi:MAG: hypothetical protein ABSH27_05590 [Solirubrobacteraceae bacterium]|jgi:hypothetical protein